VPDPKVAPNLHQWGGLDQKRALDQMEVLFDERVPVFASGLGSPAFLLKRAHELNMMVWGLVGKAAPGEEADRRRYRRDHRPGL